MIKRELGQSGIAVAPLSLGGNVFGWTVGQGEGFNILDAFLDAGLNLIDTADMYSTWGPGNHGGESESMIGEWLYRRKNRGRLVIATKVGKSMGEGKKGLSKKYILQAVEDSLQRLRTDYIDLYQTHEDDPDTAIEETLQTFDQLIREGKVRCIGASNYSAARLSESLLVSKETGFPRYEVLQPHYNLYDRKEFEEQYDGFCHSAGISVISYWSLASGFLTGKYRSDQDLAKSPRGQGMTKYFNPRGFRIVDTLVALAQRHQATPAAIALAWLMTRPSIAAPIASATSLAQLTELTKSLDIILSGEELQLLVEVSSYE